MSTVQAVSLKLPSLWTDDVEGWFLHIESQFTIRKITAEDTKYHYVVAALDSSVSSRVRSLLRQTPSYEDLKAALIEKYCLTSFERASRIRAITDLGGSKPSDVMDNMMLLLGDNQPDIMFRHHFITILPDYVRNVLSLSSEKDLTKLAAEADQIYLAGNPGNSVCVVDDATDHTDMEMSAAQVGRPSRRQGWQQRSRYNKKDNWCYYHKTFGERAVKCSEPCAWYSGNHARGQQK